VKDKNKESAVSFYDLLWDTDFFGVTCAKAVLDKSLTLTEWNNLKKKLKIINLFQSRIAIQSLLIHN